MTCREKLRIEHPECIDESLRCGCSGLSIEIVYSDFSSDVLSGVKYFELIEEARMFKIEHIDSDIYTFIPAEHVIRIGKIWEDADL